MTRLTHLPIVLLLVVQQIPELNAHIIQLVRDPRGIVNSVSSVEGWSNHMTPSKTCLMIRNDLEASVEFEQHPRFLRVRFVVCLLFVFCVHVVLMKLSRRFHVKV